MNVLLGMVSAASLGLVAVSGGIYGLAAMLSTSVASSISTDETRRHTQVVEFQATLKRASAEHMAARTLCEPLKGVKRQACIAEARAGERRAILHDLPSGLAVP